MESTKLKQPSVWAYEDYNEYLDAYAAWKKMIEEQSVQECDASKEESEPKS